MVDSRFKPKYIKKSERQQKKAELQKKKLKIRQKLIRKSIPRR